MLIFNLRKLSIYGSYVTGGTKKVVYNSNVSVLLNVHLVYCLSRYLIKS